MKKNITFPVLLALASFAAASINVTSTLAEETTGEKIQNEAGDMKTETKKGVRSTKRKVRRTMKKDTVDRDMKDMKDYSRDASDEIENEAEKAKRKID